MDRQEADVAGLRQTRLDRADVLGAAGLAVTRPERVADGNRLGTVGGGGFGHFSGLHR